MSQVALLIEQEEIQSSAWPFEFFWRPFWIKRKCTFIAFSFVGGGWCLSRNVMFGGQSNDEEWVEGKNQGKIALHADIIKLDVMEPARSHSSRLSDIDVWLQPFAVTSWHCSDPLAAREDAHGRNEPALWSCQSLFWMTGTDDVVGCTVQKVKMAKWAEVGSERREKCRTFPVR